MPHILPVAASAMAAAAPAAAATAAKATLMTTLKTVALKALTQVAITAAMSALQPQVGAAGRTFEWVIDADGPIPFAAGRVGVPGSVIHKATFGPDLMYYGLPTILSGAGPIDGIESVKVDDELVTFDVNGKAVSSQYANELWFRSRPGTQPDTALTSPPGLKNSVSFPGWTASHRTSGLASYLIIMGENSKGTAFPLGEVKPVVVMRGLRVYDPRLDSTYPGGSGPHRLHDPSTWTYSQNPILWALKWYLGLWAGPTGKGAPQVDYQVGGVGAKAAGIDFPAFVAAANVADANEWTVSAYPHTDDDKHQVGVAFLQAGGAIYAQRAGKISCIQRAAPRTSIVTITAADTAGPLEIDTAASRIDRINTIRPRFWSEAHRWQMTAMTQVSPAAYVEQDGGVRPRGIDYSFVNNARQAGQLAALQIAHTREGIAGIIPLKPHLQRIRPGDAFTIHEPGFVLDNLKCLCLNTEYDPATKIVRATFVSETDGKYPFALGLNPDPPLPQVLTPGNPAFVTPPETSDWTVIPREPGEDGIQVPIVDLVGEVSNETATSMIVEYGAAPAELDPGVPIVDQVEWFIGWEGPPTTNRVPISGPQPGGSYYLAVIYRRNQNYSARTLIPGGPITWPGLAAGVDPEELEELVTDKVAEATEALTLAQEQLQAAMVVVQDAQAALSAALGAAETGLQEAIDAVDTKANGIQSIVTAQGVAIDGKASQTALDAQITRIDTSLASIGTINATLADLPNHYASASQFLSIKSEVEAARGGSASLSGRFSTLATAITDGLALKVDVSTYSLLVARMTAAEGDIGSLEGSVSTAQSAIVDLQANKVSTSTFLGLQNEIIAARAGQANLSGRFTQMNTVITDGLNLKVDTSTFTTLQNEIIAARAGQANLSGRFSQLNTVITDGLALKVDASTYATLVSEITNARNGQTTLKGRIDGLQSTLTDAINLKASAGTVSDIVSEITAARDGLSSLSARFNSVVSTFVDGLAGKVGVDVTNAITARLNSGGDVYASIQSAASVAASADGKASAVVGFNLDVNGYAVGLRFANNGTTGSLTLITDTVEIRSGSTSGERMQISGKTIKGWYANGQQAYQLG